MSATPDTGLAHNGVSSAVVGGADKHDWCLQHPTQVLLTVENLKSIQAEMNSYTAQMSPSIITYLWHLLATGASIVY